MMLSATGPGVNNQMYWQEGFRRTLAREAGY
jgi:hypothetical protein